jgi:hypothetical protein
LNVSGTIFILRGGLRFLFAALFISVAIAGGAFGQVTTYHYDNARTGANLNETVLTTSNVNVNTFGKLFSLPLDGQVYAQPLYVPSLAIPQKGLHNVVYVATEHNSVYAFDADLPGSPLWQVNLGPSMPYAVCCAPRDLLPEIGITSTPVIDRNSGILYVVAESYESGVTYFRLHALDITTGIDTLTPAVIQGSVPGNSSDSRGGVLTFAPFTQWQRPGLLLLNGNVYIGFGSHQDTTPYHGWLFAYSAATLQQTGILSFSPDGGENGVWQGGVGLTADAGGNIYIETGNGPFNANTGGRDYGDSIVKVGTSGSLAILDYFTPSTQASDNANDWDLGSSGVLLIPGTSLGVAGGKDGKLYVFSTANLGQFHAGGDQLVQEWQATFAYVGTPGGFWGGNYIYYNSALYGFGERDLLKTFLFSGSLFSTTPASQSTFIVPSGFANDPAISISANGLVAGTGIVWAAFSSNGVADGSLQPGVFHAFDAANTSRELWNSNQNSARDYSGSWAKWCPPIVANGKVYLASFDKVLNVYGLLSASGGGGSLTGSGTSATTPTSLTGEGSADWVHWGDSSLNRKAGVTPQISNYSIVGSGGVQRYSNDPRALSWTDGTPAAIGTNNNGIYITSLQSGFVLSVPADTSTRNLTVHVGGWQSGGTLRAHLSDGSAPDFIDSTSSAGGQYDRNYTLTYTAASAGQTLAVSWVVTSGTGNVTLNGAALSLAGLNISATSGTPQSATVNTAFTTALQATVRDANNNPMSGVIVTFTAPAAGATAAFSGSTTATAMTNASGIAIAPALTANSQAGAYTVTASAPGTGSAASFSLTNLVVPPASISATAGTPQTAIVNSAFTTALQVTAKDTNGNPVGGGVSVTFTAPATGATATFSGSATATATTNASGIATAPPLTANSQAGAYTVTASTAGVATPASFNLTNLAPTPASISATAGTPQSTTVNTAFANALQATVKDASNTPLSGVTVTFTAPATGASAAFGGPAAVTTNANGIATSPKLTANSQAGAFTVTGMVPGVATPATFYLTNTAASGGGSGALTGSGTGVNTASNLTAEGATDWVHWGDSSLNRKAGVTPQLSNYSIVGSGGVQKYNNDPRALSWTDGAPAATGTNNNGVYISSTGNGFSFTAPADTTTRTLAVHVGGWNSSGTLTAHLSDGSAPDFVDSTTQVSGQYDRNYTLTYNAASTGQALTIRWVAASGAGNVTLNGAALSQQAGGSISATAGTPQSTTVNTAFVTALQAAVRDAGNNPLSGVTVTFTAPATGASAAFGGSVTATAITNASGIATAPGLTANSQAGSFTVLATAAGAGVPASFSLTNTAASGGGSGALTGSGTSANTTSNLTAEGPTDWVHFGDSSLTRKAGVTPQISNYSIVGSGGVLKYTNDPRALSWTDGTPAATGTNNNGIDIGSPGSGFSFTAPAGTTTHVLIVHVGGWSSGGTLTAHLSDGSALDFVDSTAQVSGQYDRNYTLTYAANGIASLQVSWVMSSGSGNVTISAVTLN